MVSGLKGKCALITGASGEIGEAAAIELAKEGVAGIALHYHSGRSKVSRTAKQLDALGCKSLRLKADLSVPVEAKRLVRDTLSDFGRIDILVCLAGHPFVRKEWFCDFERLTPAQMRRPLDVDLLGSAYVIQAAIPSMRKQRGGKIILTGSTPAITGDRIGITYTVAKAGVLALTRSLAQYLGKDNIHVNALALGAIDTESTLGHLGAKEKRQLVNEASLKRFGTPLEIGRKIVFLSSTDSDYLTGQTLVVDGGYAMR